MDAAAATGPAANFMTTYIIWIVRIALPIIFFLIWFRTQPSKDTWYSQPHEIVHDRDDMMAVRQVAGNEVPECLSTLKLKPDDEIPQLEGTRLRAGARGGKKGQGAGAGSLKKRPAAHEIEEVEELVVEKKEGVFSDGERANHEALLSFVAFAHKEQPQRVFLPDADQPPPEPPRRSTKSMFDDDLEPATSVKGREANVHAQSLLRALLHPKVGMTSAFVSKELTRQLSDSRIRAGEGTLALMAEACTSAGDLEGASSMLMQMEQEGHCPDNSLLDKVMDLYSMRKSKESAEEEVVKEAEVEVKPRPPWASASPNFDAFSDDGDDS